MLEGPAYVHTLATQYGSGGMWDHIIAQLMLLVGLLHALTMSHS